MTDMKKWIKDWRSTAFSIDPKVKTSITITIKGQDFDVLTLQHYSEEHCHGNPITTTANCFDERVEYMSRFTRDVGTSRIITVDDDPRFLLYQGPDALHWRAEIEKIDTGTLLKADRSGSTWSINFAIRKCELRYAAEKKVQDAITRKELAVVNEIRRRLKYELLSDVEKRKRDEGL